MKDLTLYLLSQLTTKPDEVVVDEIVNDTGSITLTLHVAKEDMGRVIGKDGKIIRAIRDCVKILALKQNKHVDVILAE